MFGFYLYQSSQLVNGIRRVSPGSQTRQLAVQVRPAYTAQCEFAQPMSTAIVCSILLKTEARWEVRLGRRPRWARSTCKAG